MPRPKARIQARRATNVTLPVDLLADARSLGLDLSHACERGLTAAIAKTRAERWPEENRGALASSREFVERTGLPLAGFRQF